MTNIVEKELVKTFIQQLQAIYAEVDRSRRDDGKIDELEAILISMRALPFIASIIAVVKKKDKVALDTIAKLFATIQVSWPDDVEEF